VKGMPETGGPTPSGPLLALAALVAGVAAFAYVRRVVREP
jgi:LPXTG-motif cell wall-anchored protein